MGIKWLSVHLMNERDSRCRRPELQGSVMSKAVSIYSTERLVDLKLDDKGISFFKVNIFIDLSMKYMSFRLIAIHLHKIARTK